MLVLPAQPQASAAVIWLPASASGRIGSVIVNEDDGEFLGIFTVTDALNALIEISRAGREHD